MRNWCLFTALSGIDEYVNAVISPLEKASQESDVVLLDANFVFTSTLSHTSRKDLARDPRLFIQSTQALDRLGALLKIDQIFKYLLVFYVS